MTVTLRDAAAAAALRDLFGPAADPAVVARAADAVPGAAVLFRAVGRGPDAGLLAAVDHPHLAAGRLFRRDAAGDVVLDLIHQRAAEPLRGGGWRRFATALAARRALGVRHLYADATGAPGTDSNGYYTWPRYGFDGPLPPDAVAALPRDVRDRLRAAAGRHPTLHALFALPGGPEAWQAHGRSVEVHFDLAPDSPHSAAWEAYYRDRERREATVAGNTLPGTAGDPGGLPAAGGPGPGGPPDGDPRPGEGPGGSPPGLTRFARAYGRALRRYTVAGSAAGEPDPHPTAGEPPPHPTAGEPHPHPADTPVTCPNCDTPHSDDLDLVDTANGDTGCPHCTDDCWSCGETHLNNHLTGDILHEDGEEHPVCDGCLGNRRLYRGCADCNSPVESNALADVSGPNSYREHLVCPTCADEYTQCPDCNEYFHNDSDTGENASGETICRSCDQNYRICDDCDNVTHVSECNRHEGRRLCNDCLTAAENANNVDDLVHPYRYKPTWESHGEGGRHYGVELETVLKTGSPRGAAEHVLNGLNRGLGEEEFAFLKEDGSLSGGVGQFEIVTHPATLEVHKERWPAVLKPNAFPGLVSHDAPCECGLHIHVEREDLSDLAIGKMLAFVNAAANRPLVEAVARRTSDRYAKLDPTKTVTSVAKPSGNRYEAINLEPDDTVEFRIFKGTLDPESFFRSLEFADAVTEFARPTVTSVREMVGPDRFAEFVARNRKRYPHLYPFLEAFFGRPVPTPAPRKYALAAGGIGGVRMRVRLVFYPPGADPDAAPARKYARGVRRTDTPKFTSLVAKMKFLASRKANDYRARRAAADPAENADRVVAHVAANGPTARGTLQRHLALSAAALDAAVAHAGDRLVAETRSGSRTGGGRKGTYYSPAPAKLARPRESGFLDALRRVRSRQQGQLRRIADYVHRAVGLDPASVRDVVFDAGRVALNGAATAVYHSDDRDAVRYAAAWYGLLTGCPAVAVLHAHDDGPDSLYKVKTDGPGDRVRAALDRHGIPRRHLVPTPAGFDVLVLDRGRHLGDRVRAFAAEHGADVYESRGTAEVLGGGGPGARADAAGRAAYRKVIEEFEAAAPAPTPETPRAGR